MHVHVYDSQRQTALAAASLFAATILSKPDAVLGLATGSTPLLLYRVLVDMQLDWRRVRTFNLDEYLGLAPDHPQSYHHFMWENLFRHVNIRPENVHIPDGLAADVPAFCADYEARIRAVGGIDLQLLGIGSDGHIGFNEPSSSLVSRTRIKTLTQRTRADNARFFASADEVPRRALSMGIGTIMRARGVVLVIYGADKAEITAKALKGPVTPEVPASILQFHPNCTVLLDEAAASRL